MSRSTSPIPRYMSTSPLPQQITEDSSGEAQVMPVSFSAGTSFPSVVSGSFPPTTPSQTSNVTVMQGQLYPPMTQPRTSLLAEDSIPPPMRPLTMQPSFPQQGFDYQDPFLPSTGQSMSTSQLSAPQYAGPPVGTLPAALPPSMGLVSSASIPTSISSVPVTSPPSMGPVPWTLPLNMGPVPATMPPSMGLVPVTLPPTSAFPSMGAPSQTLLPSSRPFTTEPSDDPFKDPFYAPAPVSRNFGNFSQNNFNTSKPYDYNFGTGVDAIKRDSSVGDRTADDGVGGIFLMCGFFGILMLILIPVWDGISLLNDPVWMYMAGDFLPRTLIACVAAIPALFFLTVIMLLACGSRRAGANSEQTMLGAALLFTLLLGSMLLLVAQPITRKAHSDATELLDNCKTGVQTSQLYKEYESLQQLRTSCGKDTVISSVEECKGFHETSESRALKEFEKTFLCSGFCYYPKVAPAASSLPANGTKGNLLLQVDKRVYASTSATSQSTDLYPPALFSNVKYQGSCSAMAARNMESFVSDMSKQLTWEGFFLIGASILQSFLMIIGLVARKESPQKPGYGTIPVPVNVLPGTMETLASSGGDFRRRQKMVEM